MNSAETNSKRFKERRAYKIAFLAQQVLFFEHDLRRLKAQLEEIKRLNEYE